MFQTIIPTINSVIQKPAIFIGIIALLGLILQRKSFSEILKGTVKAIIGVMLLLAGVDLITKAITPLSSSFSKLFSIDSSIELYDFGKFIGDQGSTIGIVMFFGFLGNILLARITPMKNITLTGHVIYWFAVLFVATGVSSGLKGPVLIIFSTVILALYLTVMPALVRPLVKKLRGKDEFTVGHTAAMWCITGSMIGKYIGNKENNAENIKLHPSLNFFRDNTVTSGLVLVFVYLIVGILVPTEVRKEFYGEGLVLSSIVNGLSFAVAMIVLLSGARMMLAEIVPAFQGISEKLVPNSIPALDIPLIFPMGPNSLVIGFIVAMFTSISTIFILGYGKFLPVALVPMTIACYFDVAPGSIFANSRGGIVAVIVSAAINGVLMMLIVAALVPLIADTLGSFVQIYGGNDFALWGLLSFGFAKIVALFGG